jgi:hypothetical protein
LSPHVEFKPGNSRFSKIDRGGGTSTGGGVGAGIFDEIVVDTGGADRTVEIGRLLGAKAAKIARTKNSQSSLPSCHLRGKELALLATFVARNSRFVQPSWQGTRALRVTAAESQRFCRLSGRDETELVTSRRNRNKKCTVGCGMRILTH